jgi:oligoendopeptidase F
MNAVGLHRDLVTLMHETGHAVHFFLNNPYPVLDFKSPPSEVAELASMSMELITMEHWDVFFNNPNDLMRARQQQLESVIEALPWIAAIDQFQHLLYEHPNHSIEERYEFWLSTIQKFSPKNIIHKGLEEFLKIRWQAQLHIYEVPFYYIEYSFAQLGAIAIWKNYKDNPTATINAYKTALSLGNTRPIPEIYKAAGISFDFSENYIQSLIDFVWTEYEKCLI